jgi:hypothetical protein
VYNASYVNPGTDRNGYLPTYSQWTSPVQNSRIKTYICPADYTMSASEVGRSSYGQNGQVFRAGYGDWGNQIPRFPASLMDGTSNTIFYTDKLAHCNSGTYPDNYWPDWGPIIASEQVGDPVGTAYTFQVTPKGNPANCEGGLASSPHSSGINVGLADGSTRFVQAGVSGFTWWSAMTINGGEVLGNDW